MEQFKGMTFTSNKPYFPSSRIPLCSKAMKEASRVYMNNVVKFIDAEPVLPILPEYNIKSK